MDLSKSIDNAAFTLGSAAETNSFSVRSATAPYIQSQNWIWSSDAYTKNSVSYFRRSVDLKSVPVHIEIKTSAHNYLKFYFNGNLISGLCSPATSTIPDNKNYLHYLFTGRELSALLDADCPTHVAFASMVQYLGSNGMNYINGVPGFWAEITIAYMDKSSEIIYTDSTWDALADTPFKKGTPSQQNRNMTAQLDYDARKMLDMLAFTEYDYDVSSYTAGTWSKAVPANESAFLWKMREQQIPEGTIHENLTPIAIATQKAGIQVFDAKRIVSGFPKIKISAPAGTKICIRYSEDLTEDGTRVQHNVANEGREIGTIGGCHNYCDYYTFSGNGTEEFCPDFTYKAFRYFEIEGLPQMIDVSNVTVEWASSGIKNTSTFNCSDNMMNKIYAACINTQYNNVQNMPVDCPHREQAQYLGDCQMQYDLLSYAFSHFNEIHYKTLLDFSGAQLENGQFPFITPTTVKAFQQRIPEYDLRYPSLLYQYYYYSGNTDVLREFYENAKRVTEFYYGFVDAVGLMSQPPFWSISDWPSPSVDDSGKYQTTMNLHLYDALNKVSMIAALIGKANEAKDYAARAEKISSAITLNLIDSSTGLYADSSESTSHNPGVTAFAIDLGQSPKHLRKQQLDSIAKTELNTIGALPSKVILTRHVLHVLLSGDDTHKEAACNIMTRTTGYEWGRMIQDGYETIWEGFEQCNSHSHAWTAYPARMMLQYLAGIRYNGVNYTNIEIKPYLPKGQTFVEGSLTIPGGRGIIFSKLEKISNSEKHLTITTPAETLVCVPRCAKNNTVISGNNMILFQNEQAQATTEKISYLRNDLQYIYFNVQPGSYTFISSCRS